MGTSTAQLLGFNRSLHNIVWNLTNINADIQLSSIYPHKSFTFILSTASGSAFGSPAEEDVKVDGASHSFSYIDDSKVSVTVYNIQRDITITVSARQSLIVRSNSNARIWLKNETESGWKEIAPANSVDHRVYFRPSKPNFSWRWKSTTRDFRVNIRRAGTIVASADGTAEGSTSFGATANGQSIDITHTEIWTTYSPNNWTLRTSSGYASDSIEWPTAINSNGDFNRSVRTRNGNWLSGDNRDYDHSVYYDREIKVNSAVAGTEFIIRVYNFMTYYGGGHQQIGQIFMRVGGVEHLIRNGGEVNNSRWEQGGDSDLRFALPAGGLTFNGMRFRIWGRRQGNTGLGHDFHGRADNIRIRTLPP